MKLVIDSSVFISHLGKNDEFTSGSKLFFTTIFEQKEELVIPTLVIAEILTILSQQNHTNLKLIYNTFNDFNIIDISSNFLEKFVDLLIKKHPSMKTSDLVIAATAKFNDSTLITWDRKILKPAKLICPTFTPKQYIEEIKSN